MEGREVGVFAFAFESVLAGKINLPARPSLRYGLPPGGFGTRAVTLRPRSA